MVVLEREPREYARDYALRVLKYNITCLELAPGSMVSEQELASALRLSRGPVREALIELAAVKIFEVYPQRGSRIALVDYKLAEEARFVRTTLEVAVVEKLCGMDATLRELGENVQLQRHYLENGIHEKLWGLDNEFHRLLFTAAGVSQGYALMKSMQIHFDRVRLMVIGSEGVLSRNVGEHIKIFEAIAVRGSAAAKELMRRHLNHCRIDKEIVIANYPQYVKDKLAWQGN